MDRRTRTSLPILVATLLILPSTGIAGALTPAPGVGPGLAEVAERGALHQVNELAKRRRLTTFFYNEQSPFYGVQVNYVNVRRGNLTFLNRDLVRLDRVPLVFGRIYDSQSTADDDFGPGWKLSVAESIRIDGAQLRYTDASGSEYVLQVDGRDILSTYPHLTGIDGGQYRGAEVELHVGGFTKRFRQMRHGYYLTEVRDNVGNAIRLQYDGKLIKRILTSHGRFVDVRRDNRGRITSVRDDAGRLVTYEYNKTGQLVSVRDLGGGRWTISYDARGLLAAVIDPRGTAPLTVAHDDAHRVRQVHVLHDSMSFDYSGPYTTIHNGLSQSAVFWHDQSGLTRAAKDFTGGLTELKLNERLQPAELSFNGRTFALLQYSDSGLLRGLQSFLGSSASTSVFEYDERDRPTSVNTDGRPVARYEYDAAGDTRSAVDWGGSRSYDYGSANDLQKVTVQGVQLRLKMNDLGLLAEFGDRDQRVRIDYDREDHVQAMRYSIDGLKAESRYEYSRQGLRTSGRYLLPVRGDSSRRDVGTNVELTLSFDYDKVGNLTGLAQGARASASSQTYVLGDKNEVTRLITSQGQVFTYDYDAAGRPTRSVVDGSEAVFEYDTLGRLSGLAVNGRDLLDSDYGPMDVDEATEADGRTAAVSVAEPIASAVFGTLESIAYARTSGTPFGPIRFNAAMARFVLASSLVPARDVVTLASFKRRALPLPGGEHHYGPAAAASPAPLGFDKPSNGLFVPPEFSSLNCYLCTATANFNSVVLTKVNGVSSGVAEFNVGEGVIVQAAVTGPAECWAGMELEWPDSGIGWFGPYTPAVSVDWGDGDSPSQGYAGGTFQWLYSTPGDRTISSTIYCSACYNPNLIVFQQRAVTVAHCSGLPCSMELLITKIKLTGATFNAINLALHASDLSVGLVKNTITWGINDINTFVQTDGLHVTNPQSSLIAWQTIQVDWSQYGAGTLPAEQVLAAWIQDGLD